MALPTGQIDATNLNTEVRAATSTTQISLSDQGVRTAAKKYSGQISFGDLQGKTYGSSVLFVGTTTSPAIHAYKWDKGFGTKYANPASTQVSCYTIFTPPSRAAVGATTGSATNRYTMMYPWSDASGFGTRFTLSGSYPSSLPGGSTGGDILCWNTPGNVVVISGSSTAPNVVAFVWSDSTGFGTKYADPPTSFPRTYCQTIAGARSNWDTYLNGSNVTDDFIFGSTTTSATEVLAWAFNDVTGWGSKYADPASLPIGSVYGIESDVFTVYAGTSSSSTSERRAWAADYTQGVGWGTAYSAMTTTHISSTPNGVSIPFVKTGSYTGAVSFALTSSPYIMVIGFNVGWGTKYTDPATLPTNSGEGVSFNNKIDLAVAHAVSPYITAYPWNNAFGTKYVDATTVPSGNGFGVHYFHTQI